MVCELTGAPAACLIAEMPLMEAGVDSLVATELSLRLRMLVGVALSPTIIFEQPTPRAVAAHLLEQAITSLAVNAVSTVAVHASNPWRWPSICDG